MMNHRELALPERNLLELARSFPTLAQTSEQFFERRALMGGGQELLVFAREAGALEFAKWVRAVGGGGMRDAGLFVLSVWSSSDDWREIAGLSRDDGPTGGRFDVHRALGNWDQGHRGAFLAWAARPWWL